jgi:glucose-6-phosphate 1-dehydrogenase
MSAPLVATCTLAEPRAAERTRRRAGPCTVIILGANGDLARRKLIPALARLASDGLLDPSVAIICVARDSEMTDASYRRAMAAAIDAAGDPEPGTAPATARDEFLERLHYVAGDLRAADTYARLTECLDAVEGARRASRGRLFYLAIPPSLYAEVARHLAESGLAPRRPPDDEAWVRLVIEKPFGHDLASACALNRFLAERFSETQVYRIDHYLGKETVQNLLVLRFANSILEPVWNRNHVDHVQITAAETLGVEHRAAYYEEAGVLRDMFQNHLLQLLTLTAMEPPNTFGANPVRDEKVKVLGAIHPLQGEDARAAAVLGQYEAGVIAGTPVPGYREEPGVAPGSRVPTYAALRLVIDSWRWEGVPFYLRSGKRLAKRVTEIAVQFRRPPHLLFRSDTVGRVEPNVLAIRIQPDEGIAMRFEVKAPGVDVRLAPVQMHFSYEEAFGPAPHDAYETLLLDCMLGDATLFARADEVEGAWRVIDPIIQAWSGPDAPPLAGYPAGTWGPAAADALVARDGAAWRTP